MESGNDGSNEINENSAQGAQNRVVRFYSEKIDRTGLTEERKAELKKGLVDRYRKMKYEHGEAIGVVAAQSISEPATQTTLRSYHRVFGTGLHTTRGLPRIIELFDARKNPKTPSMTIFLDAEHNDMDNALDVASNIRESKLKQVISEDSLDLVNLKIDVVLDMAGVKALGLTTEEIVSILKKNIKNIEVRGEKNGIAINLKKKEFSIKDLQALRVKVRNVYIKGMKGITQGIVRKEKEDWVIRTIGTNLKKVLKMTGVDSSRTTSNNIHEISEVLGIEAARNSIINETMETLKEQGVNTDIRHILLVADAMTYLGEINAIGRYGLAGAKSSVLSRANFEETVRHLTDASVSGEVDPLQGIVENIIVGKLALIGTGMVEVGMADEVAPPAEEDKEEEVSEKKEKAETKEEKKEKSAKKAADEKEKPKKEKKK